jgi:hypothetical protein
MAMRKLLLAVLVGFWGMTSLEAQEIKSPADLMPAGALFYGEIRQPGPLVQEAAKLVEGSALANVPDSLQKLRGKYEKFLRYNRFEELAVAGMFFSPEVIKELGRVQGAGFAMTGLSPRGEPEFAVVVLPGQSNVPAFMMRMFLSMERVRQVDTVEDVPLYRMYRLPFAFTAPALGKQEEKPGQPEMVEMGPVFARTEGLIVLGSSETVKDVIRRAKGKGKGMSLAEDKTFQEASKSMDNKPGLFAYASGVRLSNLFQGKGGLGREEEAVLGMIKSWKSVAWNLTLDQGTLHFREVAILDSANKNQVLDLLPSKGVDPTLFHFAPKDAVLAIALANPEGEKRWGKLLNLVDQSFPAIQGRKPSELLKDLEDQFGISVGKEVVGPIAGVGFAMGDPTKATVRRIEKKGPNFQSVMVTTEIPVVIIVQATDDKAAQELEKLVPKLFGLINRQPGEPTSETVGGVEIRTLKGRGNDNFSYGRQGNTLVLGPYSGPVAMALLGGGKKQGLWEDAKLANRFKELDNPLAVLLMKPSAISMGALFASVSFSHTAAATAEAIDVKVEKVGEKKFEEKKEVKIEEEKEVRTEVVNPPRSPEEERILKGLSRIWADEQWFVLGVARKDNGLQVDGKVPGLNQVIPQLIDFGIEETYRNAALREERRFGGGGNVMFTVSDKLIPQDPKDRIRVGSYHKIYNVKMEAGSTYTIDMVTHKETFFDNYLRLEDSAGNNLAQDDDSGGNLNARIVFRPTRNDTYRIIATTLGGGATGSFTVTVRKKDEH